MRHSLCSLALFSLFLTAAVAQEPSLEEIYKHLSTRQFVDLTQTFSPSTPVWSGFGPATFSRAADPQTGDAYRLESHGFRSHVYSLVGQYGTHVDPPAHFSEKGATVDEIPVKQMILPLVVFDITGKLKDDPGYSLKMEDILAWEKEHGRVPKGAFAALRTDMSRDWASDPERFKRRPFPAWTLEAIQFLYEERGITANGHESMDTDNTPNLAAEVWLLQHGHWQIEVMANLDRVPPARGFACGQLAETLERLGLPRASFCHFTLTGLRPF